MKQSMGNILLGIDPGDACGIAILDFDTHEIIDMRIITASEMPNFLTSLDPDSVKAVIAEDFILYQNKAKEQVGSRFKAVQVLGMLHMWTSQHQIRYVKQPATVLTNGYKIADIQRQSNHNRSHDFDALIHLVVYLVSISKWKGWHDTTVTRIAE